MAATLRRGIAASAAGALPDIGVEKSLLQALPSLRTVRAVLPHTALQSIVSSSGSARFRMGFIHCEQSQAREAGICLLLMVFHQAKPFSSFDTVNQCRQHAHRPYLSFHP